MFMLSLTTVLGVKIDDPSEEQLNDDYKRKMKVVFGNESENAIITVSFLKCTIQIFQVSHVKSL